jgi:hypothetical protein
LISARSPPLFLRVTLTFYEPLSLSLSLSLSSASAADLFVIDSTGAASCMLCALSHTSHLPVFFLSDNSKSGRERWEREKRNTVESEWKGERREKGKRERERADKKDRHQMVGALRAPLFQPRMRDTITPKE